MPGLIEAQDLASRLERRELSREAFADGFSRAMTTTVGCQRASVWLLPSAVRLSRLACVGSFDALAGGPSIDLAGACCEVDSASTFLQALARDGFISATDARSHPATACLYRDMLAARGVASMLAVAMSINGTLRGAFACVSVDRRIAWTAWQAAALKRMAARVGPPLAGAEQALLASAVAGRPRG